MTNYEKMKYKEKIETCITVLKTFLALTMICAVVMVACEENIFFMITGLYFGTMSLFVIVGDVFILTLLLNKTNYSL